MARKHTQLDVIACLAQAVGIDPQGKTVEQIRLEHEASRDALYADQHDARLEEAIQIWMARP